MVRKQKNGEQMRKTIVENNRIFSDEAVVEFVKKGEYQFLPEIIDRYMPLIVSTAKAYLPQQNIDDAVQEASISLYSAIKNYDCEKSSFKTFASLCIKRSVISFARKNGAKGVIPDDMISSLEETDISSFETPEKIIIEKEDYDFFKETIKLELSKMEYDILQLFLTGASYSDIANNLSITEKSVDNALSRIRKKLKK